MSVDRQWPTAATYRGNAVPIESTLEAEFSASQLRDLAKWLNVTLKGTAKSGYVTQIGEALTQRAGSMAADPDSILAGLTDEQANFMRRALTARDRDLPLPRGVAMAVWARQYGAEAERRLLEMIESLRRRALLFPTLTYQQGSNFRDVYYQWLPLGVNTPVVQWAISTSTAPANKIEASGNFLDRLDGLLGAALAAPLALRGPLKPHAQARRTHWLTGWEHDADEADRVMHLRANWAPDPTTGLGIPLLSPFTAESAGSIEAQTGLGLYECEFVFAVACALQLLHPPAAAEAPNAAETPAAAARMNAIEEWYALPAAAKLRKAWVAYTEQVMPLLEARAAVGSMKAADTFGLMRAIGARNLSPAVLAAEWCALRRYVMRTLRGLPAGKWVLWQDFRRLLFGFFAECPWTFGSRAEWWFAGGADRHRINHAVFEGWAGTIGAVIETMLRDGFAWFGAVQTSLDREGRLESFCLTQVGAWLAVDTGAPVPSEALPTAKVTDPIKWLPDGQLRVPPAPERADFVSFVRGIADRAEQPFTFVFTPQSVERALSAGINADEVAAQFKKMGVALPRAVSSQFKLVAKRYGRVRVYPSLTILELADELALRELSANTRLQKHVLYQISPRAVVVADSAVEGLLEEMQENGYTPRVV